jgi:threonylcarbamoyladenosine tRNA methylthiotransferase MtaB
VSGAQVINFGCRLNIAEGEAIRAAAVERDDLIIFNTCAVTSEAERQARQAIRRAARANPEKRIVVTGCGAQISASRFAAMPEVAQVLGNIEKRTPGAFDDPRRVVVSNIFEDTPPLTPVVSGKGYARAHIEVQNGCDHRCTFCIIPFGRGNSRSVPAGLVVDAVARAADAGHHEIVLTGVDLTSYGQDLPGTPSLGLLVERILSFVPTLPRLRLSSLDCIEIDDRLFDLVTSEARVMPYLHLSLQAGDDMILKRMKRRHSRAQAIDLVTRVKTKRPEIAIGADIIAGFPTETDAMFENSLALIADCDIVYGHIFPFSPRSGTPAALMPQIERKLIKERAARLREAASNHKANWLASLVGSRHRVLVENDGQTGHTENFAPARLAQPAVPGSVAEAVAVSSDGAALSMRLL